MYIGIDLGTSSVKTLLMSEKGEVAATATKSYECFYPNPGWSEQNPTDWYEKTTDCIVELLQKAGKDERVRGIGVAGQMHGLVTLDENDDVIRPAILWNDGRTSEENDYLNHTIGEEKLAELCGNISFTGFTAPKLLWMKKHEPENFDRIKKVMLPKDYLNYRLSGAFATDVSDASGTLYFDVKNRRWSREMLDICNITESMLPKVHESYETIGNVKKDLWMDMANKAGVAELYAGEESSPLVVAGAGDNAGAAVSCGAIRHGDCNLSVGTSGTVFITSESFVDTDNHAIHSFCDSTGHYHLMGCMLSAATCNMWWMEDILDTSDFKKEQSEIDEALLGKNRVYFLPYLMGERSPHNDEKARGAFVGMSRDTKRSDMTLAMLEGVAFGLRDSLEVAAASGIRVTHSTICGGGVKSPLWQKIIANVLNVRLDILKIEVGPSLGGAILAAVADGVYKDVAEAADKIVAVEKSIEPDENLVSLYNERYRTYKSMYPALKEVYKKL